jgi:RNA polymerase sigma-70 factor, ECF subfamily
VRISFALKSPIWARQRAKNLIQIAASWCLFREVVSEQLKVHWCERLYEAKAGELILYGRALGLSHSEAEDVLHETFAALLQRHELPEQPEHYCVRSFRNRALNYRRGLWRRLTRELESSRWFERANEESPHERAAMHCLAGLPPEQREVIVLKIWHDYTFEEIGELLELSPNTVAGRYRYGLQRLRACLTEENYERELERFGEPVGFLDPTTPVAKA